MEPLYLTTPQGDEFSHIVMIIIVLIVCLIILALKGKDKL